MLNFKKCHEGKLYESYWKGVTQCAIFKFKLWVSLWTFPVVGGCNIYFNEILACSAAQSTEGSIVLERDGGTGSATQRHALRVFPPSETCSAVTSMPSLTRANSTSGRQSSTKVTWIQPMRLLVYFCLTCSFFFFPHSQPLWTALLSSEWTLFRKNARCCHWWHTVLWWKQKQRRVHRRRLSGISLLLTAHCCWSYIAVK